MEHVRHCAVRLFLESDTGWITVRESCSRALEQGPLVEVRHPRPRVLDISHLSTSLQGQSHIFFEFLMHFLWAVELILRLTCRPVLQTEPLIKNNKISRLTE